MNDIINDEHIKANQKFRQFINIYQENKDLIMMGGYSQGQDEILDKAVMLWPEITRFISQPENQKVDFSTSSLDLISLLKGK